MDNDTIWLKHQLCQPFNISGHLLVPRVMTAWQFSSIIQHWHEVSSCFACTFHVNRTEREQKSDAFKNNDTAWFPTNFSLHHQLLTNFQDLIFFFQNSKTKFDRLLMHSPLIQYMWYTCTFHLTVQSTVHIHLKVHMPKHCHYMKIIYISHRMKIYSQLFSKSVNCCLFCLIPEDKIHKLSKTSVELFIFHRLLRPWKWQIIFP